MATVGSAEGSARAGVLILLAVILLPAAGTLALIHSVAQPPVDRELSDPADFLLRAEDIELRSSDGVVLSDGTWRESRAFRRSFSATTWGDPAPVC